MTLKQVLYATVFFAVLLIGRDQKVRASETKYWELAKMESFAKGDMFENVTLNSRGELRIGFNYNTVKLDNEFSVWTAMVETNGDYYVGTGSGTIYKISGPKVDKIFTTGEMLVTSLAKVGDTLYAATIPNGKIFRSGSDGKWSEFAKLDCKYIWSIIPGGSDAHLYAATGSEGKLFKVHADGSSVVFYHSKTENILSLARDREGHLYFGTSGKGLLVKLERGKPTILYNFEEAEVKSIDIVGDTVYVAVNNGVKVSPSEFLKVAKEVKKEKDKVQPKDANNAEDKKEEQKKNDRKEDDPKEKMEAPDKEETDFVKLIDQEMNRIKGDGGTAKAPTPAVSSEIWKISSGQTQKLTTFPSSYVTEIFLAEDNSLIAATSNSGKVFSVEGDGTFNQLFDFAENQVLSLVRDGRKLKAVLTGDNASLHVLSSDKAVKGTYISDIFDAKYQTYWGGIQWKGEGKISLQTRSGNIGKVDESWSDWSPALVSLPARVISPKGRYFQFKITLEESTAVIRSVIAAYRNQNQKPRVRNLTLDTFYMPMVMGGMMPLGDPAGVVSGVHSAMKKVRWFGEDEDGDRLVYRLFYREIGAKNWIPVLQQPIPMMEYMWDVGSIPDGKYIVRVEVSDERGNVELEVLRDFIESDPVIIDNTSPAIKFDIEQGKVSGEVVDASSNITRLEYKLDASEWISVLPKDKLFDDKKESFEFELKGIKEGPHTLLMRAFDQENNVGSASKELNVR